MDETIRIFNKDLQKYLIRNDLTLGLANGVMGYSIYFYIVGDLMGDKSYEKTADDLLSRVLDSIDQVDTINLLSGLSGIGLGISYLIKKKYISGNVNQVLSETDDKIFQKLSYRKNINNVEVSSLIHILYYLSVRVQELNVHSENRFLYEQLIMYVINVIYEKIEQESFDEPLYFSLESILPQLLYVFGEIYSLNIYNERIGKIIEELSWRILSFVPRLHSNRLFLLWGLNHLNSLIKSAEYARHMSLIHSHINIETILHEELDQNNIFFFRGYLGIYFLIEQLKDYYNLDQRQMVAEIVKQKIFASEAWRKVKGKEFHSNFYKGILNGFCGVILMLKMM